MRTGVRESERFCGCALVGASGCDPREKKTDDGGVRVVASVRVGRKMENGVYGGHCLHYAYCHCVRSDGVNLSAHCWYFVVYVAVGSSSATRCSVFVYVVASVSGLEIVRMMESGDGVVLCRLGGTCLGCRCRRGLEVVCDSRHRYVDVLVEILSHELAGDRSLDHHDRLYLVRAHCALDL